jgi:hypothetical protein
MYFSCLNSYNSLLTAMLGYNAYVSTSILRGTAASSTNRKCRELVEICAVQVGRLGLTKVSLCLDAPACWPNPTVPVTRSLTESLVVIKMLEWTLIPIYMQRRLSENIETAVPAMLFPHLRSMNFILCSENIIPQLAKTEKKNPFWEVDSSSVDRNIPHFYITQIVVILLKTVSHWTI